MSREPARRHWENLVRALTWRVNFSTWLDRVAPGVFAVGTVAGFAAYALRRARLDEADAAGGWIWWSAAVSAGLLAVGGLAWWRARPSFFRTDDARALLEHRLGLDSVLSAAAAGVAAWPTPFNPPSLLRWRSPVTLGWLAAALVLGATGAFAPLPAPLVAPYSRASEKPPALAEAEAWLEQLAEQQVARPEDVEKLAEQARGLGERTPEERYSHSALEAADTLRSQTAQAIRGLGANLEEAAAALAALERPAGQLSDEELGAVATRLGEALRGLQEGPLAAREDLLEKLGSAANAAGRRSLSPAQAAQLRQQLAKAGRAATGVVGAQGRGAAVATADPNSRGRIGSGTCNGTCSASQNGEPCDGRCEHGTGGVSRGPGHAPLYFRDEASDAGAGKTETLTADDLSRAALGELLGMERGQHEFDPKTSVAPGAAGAIAAPGQGGEVVWVDHLTPRERAALKGFFK